MKKVDNVGELQVHQNRRAKFLADTPVKGEVMYLEGAPVRVVDVNYFEFTVEVQPSGGAAQSVPFDELDRQPHSDG